ncbi:hypothetical protein DsansV1_C10g0097111 [Dioscorea sansibarensis]
MKNCCACTCTKTLELDPHPQQPKDAQQQHAGSFAVWDLQCRGGLPVNFLIMDSHQ